VLVAEEGMVHLVIDLEEQEEEVMPLLVAVRLEAQT
jgi:hypothetical protein